MYAAMEFTPVSIFKSSDKSSTKSQMREMKLSYKCIFFLFCISGIFPIIKSFKIGFKSVLLGCITTAISLLILLFHLYFMVLAIVNYHLYQDAVANTVINLVSFAYRVLILLRWYKLMKIVPLTSSYVTNGDQRFNLCIFIWGFIIVMISLVLAYYETQLMAYIGVPFAHYGISREDYFLYNFAAALHSVYFNFIAQLPMFAFDMFYIIVCCHLRHAIRSFSKDLIEKESSYDDHLRSYVSIKSIADFVDDELSIFIVCGTVSTSNMMYYTVTTFLHQAGAHTSLYTAVIIFNFVYRFVSFIAMTMAASSVSEASAEVCKHAKAQKLDRRNPGSPIEQLKFMICADNEIYLTVWKIVPIRRSFILGAIGAIFTYVFLFDNLIKKDN